MFQDNSGYFFMIQYFNILLYYIEEEKLDPDSFIAHKNQAFYCMKTLENLIKDKLYNVEYRS